MSIIAIIAFIVGAIAAVGIPASVIGYAFFAKSKTFQEMLSGAFTSRNGPPPALVDGAIADFVDEWGRVFTGGRKEVAAAFDGLHIKWHKGDTFSHKKSALHTGIDVRGVTNGKKSIEVALRSGTIGDTAFFHELVHVTLWNIAGEPDPNHEDDHDWDTWKPEHNDLVARLKERWR